MPYKDPLKKLESSRRAKARRIEYYRAQNRAYARLHPKREYRTRWARLDYWRHRMGGNDTKINRLLKRWKMPDTRLGAGLTL